MTHKLLIERRGVVSKASSSVIEAKGPPDSFLGQMCKIETASGFLDAEVIGFHHDRVMLMPYQAIEGLKIGATIIASDDLPSITVDEAMIGHVINAFGQKITIDLKIANDDHSISNTGQYITQTGIKQLEDIKKHSLSKRLMPLKKPPINPLNRALINEQCFTGIKIIDSLFPVGKGQRMGIFAGSGVGKSTLLGMIAQTLCDASDNNSINVIALIGERGREVKEFIDSSLGEKGLKNSIVVVATADEPALMRVRAAYAATAIAEYFASSGKEVILTMDSVTRFAMAEREIGLISGEMPTSRGYTPGVFNVLPRLAERCGNFENGGSITAFYTVLVEGDDFNEPISDHMRAILDGHLILTRQLANKGQYPAIDVLQSSSRLISRLLDTEDQHLLRLVKSAYQLVDKYADMVAIGAYKADSNPALDQALIRVEKLNALFVQHQADSINIVELRDKLRMIIDD
ncbi:MAG: FliI/YscN family ATPase [Francisellaceae bacterium]